MEQSVLGFSVYNVLLFLFSGWVLLSYDAKAYRKAHMEKERKTALAAGWLNVVIGLLTFVVYYFFRSYLF